MKNANGLKFESPPARPGAGMLLGAGLILLAAIFLPLPEKLLDVLWICTFCLSGAVIIICLAARSSSDLVGFVPMISGLIFLRLTTEAAVGRHIIRDEPAGILLSQTGSALASARPLVAVLVCLLLVVIGVFVIFTACQRITQASKHYLNRIFPLKRMGIETDLRLGVIDCDQADELTRRIAAEGRFFFRMGRTALLMRTEAIMAVFILLACLVFPAAGNTAGLPYGTEMLSAVAPPVVALSIFALIPSLLVAVSCGMLMSRQTLTLRPNQPDASASPHAKTITVVALDSEGAEDTELLNPDFMQHRQGYEQIAEFEPEGESVPEGTASVVTDISCRNAKEYYEKLSRVICTITSRPRVILLASDKVDSLPVTVAVNTAIRLAQEKQRVLLVDTDDQRNAVGSVFDLDAESMRKKVQASCLENLSVCCVPAEKLNPFLRNEKVLGYFNTTLIYTPNLQAVCANPDGKAVKPGAFYFVEEGDSGSEKTAAEQKLAFCSWLCLIPSIQSALDSKQQADA